MAVTKTIIGSVHINEVIITVDLEIQTLFVIHGLLRWDFVHVYS